MSLGLTWEKLIVILVIAALLIGPERLPRYAEGLAHLVKRVRDYLRGARTRVKDEMGEDFDDVDWRTLDPRRYDPRRIIREALLDDPPVGAPVSPRGPNPGEALAAARGTAASSETVADGGSSGPASGSAREPFRPGATAPFDSEAT